MRTAERKRGGGVEPNEGKGPEQGNTHIQKKEAGKFGLYVYPPNTHPNNKRRSKKRKTKRATLAREKD